MGRLVHMDTTTAITYHAAGDLGTVVFIAIDGLSATVSGKEVYLSIHTTIRNISVDRS